jgi:PAS domain S-box-containing protein
MNHSSASSAWGASSNAWIVSLAIGAIGILYQIIVSDVIEEIGGESLEHAFDLVLFGVVNPALAFWGWIVVTRARQAERVLAAINVAVPDAIIRLDPEGRVEFWSIQAEVLLGYSAKQAYGRTMGELLGPQGVPVWSRLRDMVRSSGLVRGQGAVCRTLSGGDIPVELSASPVRDDAGRPHGMLVVLRDISGCGKHTQMTGHLNQHLTDNVEQLARANAEREHAQCVQLELVSYASHEIRGPLGNIRAATERMYSECDEKNPNCERMFGLINGQLRHVDELVRSVLGAANIDAGKLVLHKEPMSVMAAMQEVVQAMKAVGDSRPVRLSVPLELPPVDADPERVVAVLRNLLGNADKYTPPGAEIILAAEAAIGFVTLRVRDYGSGLPADTLERIFDKRYRGLAARGIDGYGLGLYICREVVTAHGGLIWAENHPDGGAVFSFTLPIAQ